MFPTCQPSPTHSTGPGGPAPANPAAEHPCAELVQLLHTSSLETLVDSLCARLMADPRIGACEINLFDPHAAGLVTAGLRLPPEYSGIEATYRGFRYPLAKPDANAVAFGSGAVQRVSAAVLDDYDETTRMRLERWKMGSLLVLPMANTGTVALFFAEPGTGEAAADDTAIAAWQSLVQLYAPQLKVYWEHHRAIEREKAVQQMHAELHQFVAYIAKMNSLTSVDQVCSLISEEFIRRFQVDAVNILLEEDGALPMVHTGFSAGFRHLDAAWQPFRAATRYSLTVRDGQSALIFLNGQRFIVNDVMKILHLPMSDKDRQALQLLQTPRTFIIVPIQLHGRTLGVMWLVTLAQTWTPSEGDFALLELLASFVGTAIANAKTHLLVEAQKRSIEALNRQLSAKVAQLDQLARKDRLTGLNNFGSFEEELRRRVHEAERTGAPVSLILFDIDRFKALNDSHGHPAGNEVLKHVAARISINVRDMDFVARYGGEEFAVLLPACDLASAAVVAERVREDIEQAVIATGKHQHQITISAGCAEFAVCESSAQFVSRVDASLYAAKHQGRNRVVTAGPPAVLVDEAAAQPQAMAEQVPDQIGAQVGAQMGAQMGADTAAQIAAQPVQGQSPDEIEACVEASIGSVDPATR